MQYGLVRDLLREAERAGERETEGVNERLAEAFDTWLSGQELEGISVTEEEVDDLHKAFAKGFCLGVHNAA